MQAGGPVHDPLVSFPARDPGAEADGQGAGGCEGVSVCTAVFGRILKIVFDWNQRFPHPAGISCLNGGFLYEILWELSLTIDPLWSKILMVRPFAAIVL